MNLFLYNSFFLLFLQSLAGCNSSNQVHNKIDPVFLPVKEKAGTIKTSVGLPLEGGASIQIGDKIIANTQLTINSLNAGTNPIDWPKNASSKMAIGFGTHLIKKKGAHHFALGLGLDLGRNKNESATNPSDRDIFTEDFELSFWQYYIQLSLSTKLTRFNIPKEYLIATVIKFGNTHVSYSKGILNDHGTRKEQKGRSGFFSLTHFALIGRYVKKPYELQFQIKLASNQNPNLFNSGSGLAIVGIYTMKEKVHLIKKKKNRKNRKNKKRKKTRSFIY